MGEKIIVQGGPSIMMPFSGRLKGCGTDVVRPDIAGIMGAFGAAILSRERYAGEGLSTMLAKEELKTFSAKSDMKRCELCGTSA